MTSPSANPRARPLINLYHKVVNFHKTTRNLLRFFAQCCWWCCWRRGGGGGQEGEECSSSFSPAPPFSPSAPVRNNKTGSRKNTAKGGMKTRSVPSALLPEAALASRARLRVYSWLFSSSLGVTKGLAAIQADIFPNGKMKF